EGIPYEPSPASFPWRQVAGERYPQRQVAGESPRMSLGKAVNVVVFELFSQTAQLVPAPRFDVDSVNQNVEASVEHRLVQRRSIPTSLEEGSSKRKQVSAVVGSSSRPVVLARHLCFDEQDVDPFVRDVQEAYFTHNLLSRLNCPSIQRRLDGLSFDELSNVYDDEALRLAMARNMLTNESHIML
nr:hypothetical protein [Tanacetum cinerariifolium]